MVLVVKGRSGLISSGSSSGSDGITVIIAKIVMTLLSPNHKSSTFFTYPNDFSPSLLSHTVTAPAIVSECPLKNLVALWMTISAPISRGRDNMGLIIVLSMESSVPPGLLFKWHILAISRILQIRWIGFVGDSIMTNFVAGKIASRRFLLPSGPAIFT